jgi:hypothetical protein
MTQICANYKADLDRIAKVLYPHKTEERFTYSVEFMLEQIAELRKDKERLDWLGAEYDAAQGRGSYRKFIDSTMQPKPASPEVYWLIHFEDADRQPEVFTSEEPARLRYAAASESWNCTLFKSVTPIPRSGHPPKAKSATEVAQQFGIAEPRRESQEESVAQETGV